MKKIKKSRDANVGIIAIIIIVIIAIIGIIYFVNSGEAKKYWETDASFGSWAEEIKLIYEDGTSQSLKLIQDGLTDWSPLAVKYNGEEISRIEYYISAIATGEGYEGALVDVNDLFIEYKIVKMPIGTVKRSHDQQMSGQISCPLTIKTEIADRHVMTVAMDDPDEFPAGTYEIRFIPSGTVKFKGYPDGGSWLNVGLPPGRTVIVQVAYDSTMKIAVTLYSDIDIS